MKLLVFIILLTSFSAWSAQKIECEAGNTKFTVSSTSASNITITHRGETVQADGFMDQDEVDLVARFSSIGEMTLFAKIGKVSQENYVFFQGKRFSAICR
jgi:hypothetical protein